jgi:hypothetical protein
MHKERFRTNLYTILLGIPKVMTTELRNERLRQVAISLADKSVLSCHGYLN